MYSVNCYVQHTNLANTVPGNGRGTIYLQRPRCLVIESAITHGYGQKESPDMVIIHINRNLRSIMLKPMVGSKNVLFNFT